MNLRISNADARPIYEQLRQQIRKSILNGELKEGEALPSIRALAKDLRISVITTKRAYDELERDGYIHTVAGKGCYVAPLDSGRVREDCLCRIEEQLQKALELAHSCGVSVDELAEMLHAMEEGNEDGKCD